MKAGEAPAPAGAAFEWGGRRSFLPAVTQDDKHELAVWAAAQALARVRAMTPLVARGELSAADYADDYETTLRQVQAGNVWWDEPGGPPAPFRGLARGPVPEW